MWNFSIWVQCRKILVLDPPKCCFKVNPSFDVSNYQCREPYKGITGRSLAIGLVQKFYSGSSQCKWTNGIFITLTQSYSLTSAVSRCGFNKSIVIYLQTYANYDAKIFVPSFSQKLHKHGQDLAVRFLCSLNVRSKTKTFSFVNNQKVYVQKSTDYCL